MGLLSNRISREQLQQGDHIYSYRNGHAYSHHGIYVICDGKGSVIHFTASRNNSTVRSEYSRSNGNRRGKCDECGHDPSTCPGGVLETCLDCFLKGHGLLRFEYGVSAEKFKLKHKGSCSIDPCEPPDVTVKRAVDFLLGCEGFGEYNLLDNNCESFAAYCKRGKRVSEQGLEAASIAQNITADASASASTSASAASVPSASSAPSSSAFKQIASFVVPKVITYITSKASSSSR